MKKSLLNICFCLFCCCMSAQQNLVPNGSFEEYTVCPSNQGQVTGFVKNWFDPTFSSSDYYNSCSSNGVSGVPNNFYGYKNANAGNGISGFSTYSGIAMPNSREYLGVKLMQNLTLNGKYCLTCYVSPSGNWKFATNGISFFLLVDTLGIYNYNLNILNYSPIYVENKTILDTNNWTKIEFEFINNIPNVKFLIIGSSLDDVNIAKSIINGNAYDISYYYIDNITLRECNTSDLVIPNVFTPNDDLANDFWEFNLNENAITVIYNRWGNKIFDTSKPIVKWDGRTTSGELCSEGTYYYIIQTETETYKGFIQLIR